nr:unnamed protein product [Spirometra erinaceieuropaei]
MILLQQLLLLLLLTTATSTLVATTNITATTSTSIGCASFLAVDDRYNLLVFASCSIALCVWMTIVACAAFYVYKVYPLTTVV